jgi:hypothetical protein
MAGMADPKTVLHHYLQQTRDAVVWKLDGLSERDARLPAPAVFRIKRPLGRRRGRLIWRSSFSV